jgi:hypothetical protein
MKLSEADIVLVPGLGETGAEHWMSRWEQKIKSARRVDLPNPDTPNHVDWVDAVRRAVNSSQKPVVLVGHGLGVAAIVHAATDLIADVKGAFLVSPRATENSDVLAISDSGFGAYPRDPLPYPSFVVHSQNDNLMDQAMANDLAAAWGSFFVDAREQGHINEASGHGPWPEGLMVFSKFLSRL